MRDQSGPDARPLSQLFEQAEDIGTNATANETLGDVIAERFSRRDVMRGGLAATVIAGLVPAALLATGSPAAAQTSNSTPSFDFAELAADADVRHHVAEGYDADVLIRWGDKVLAGAAEYDPHHPSAPSQAQQFGYNNDFVGYIPIDGRSDHGLLVVNHEYTNQELMFPGRSHLDLDPNVARFPDELADIAKKFGLKPSLGKAPDKLIALASYRNRIEQMPEGLVAVEMMAHGGSVIEIKRDGGKWKVVDGSKFARRITAETDIDISGPAAGHALLRTTADPEGRRVKGMVNNCAGGVTPWGTWLTCEENFNGYFWGKAARSSHPQGGALKRYGAPSEWYAWGRFHDRFDISKEPNEVHRFGWVVEIDPMEPQSRPVKRTALGRFKHEGAGNIVNKDGRFVIYQGDDQRFDYVYKFVTAGKVDLDNRAANKDLLDAGTLYVAKYNADGTGKWLPLRHGEGLLTVANGFGSQAEVLIFARLAADLVGATKMDRPEDIEVNPKTNKVYVMLTNNTRRTADQLNAANPRARNAFGHIIEMTPKDGDHASDDFSWEILVKCGDPAVGKVGATFNPRTTKDGWFGMPDNCVVDADGRLWIATDGNSQRKTGRNDGIWAMETEGAARGTSKLFFRCPDGAEMCGPMFTPDLETLFVAVQHPGDSVGKGQTTFEKPSTRWPDFKDDMPPRPSVVAITRKGGGKIAR
jgi:uncharacterized protein